MENIEMGIEMTIEKTLKENKRGRKKDYEIEKKEIVNNDEKKDKKEGRENEGSEKKKVEKKIDESVFNEVYEFIKKSKKNIFISGKAGTGKSTFIEYLKRNLKENYALLSPTGTAALNIGGKTIHSFFKLPIGIITSEAIKNISIDKRRLKLFRKVKTIIVDEISMVRADVAQGIDYILKKSRKNNKAFGGVRMILVGDLYQLSPVVENKDIMIVIENKKVYEGKLRDYFNKKYGGCYFFDSNAFKEGDFYYYELEKVFRQKDKKFIDILNKVRLGRIEEKELEIINKKKEEPKGEEIKEYITLCARKAISKDINIVEMSKLKGGIFEYEARIQGSFLKVSENDYPVDRNLLLKKGARIMMIVNDSMERWVNGTVGTVDRFEGKKIIVNINGKEWKIEKHKWEYIEYEYDERTGKFKKNITGTYEQYPVILAWAITIHKSQGKTFEKVIIDMGEGAFAEGQVYVALSRCKMIEGLMVRKDIKKEDIIVDKRVNDFMEKMREKSLINEKREK